MKILLINTPRSPENAILAYAPEEARRFIHKKLIGPPLGLLTVAAAVKDHDVVVWDTKGEYDLDPDAPDLETMVLRLLHEHHPDVVGTTVITSEFDYGTEILRTAKKFDPSILTVIGGLHATLCGEDFTDPSIDIVCPGEAAGTFRDLIRAFEKNKDLEGVPGILINDENGLHVSKARRESWDAAGKDFIRPDRSHLRRWIDTYKVGNSPFPSTYVITSLGCPYKCTFCSIWGQFHGKYYQRHLESVIQELKTLDEYPVVRFADANTIVNVEFISALFDRIIEEGIRKTFVMDIRADSAVNYPWLIEKCAKGGLKVVICGFESYKDEELKRYKKQSKAIRNQEAIKIFEQNGIMLRGNYVVPSHYDHDDFKGLADFAAEHRVVYAGYTILSPMPGTLYFNEVRNEIIDWDYKKYNFFNSVMKTKLPHDEFHERVGSLWLIKKGKDVI